MAPTIGRRLLAMLWPRCSVANLWPIVISLKNVIVRLITGVAFLVVSVSSTLLLKSLHVCFKSHLLVSWVLSVNLNLGKYQNLKFNYQNDNQNNLNHHTQSRRSRRMWPPVRNSWRQWVALYRQLPHGGGCAIGRVENGKNEYESMG